MAKLTRGTWVVVKDPKTGEIDFVPKSEYSRAQYRSGMHIISDIAPYKNMIDGKVVAGRRQHRDFLRAHGVVEVGNEKPVQRSDNSNRVDMGLVTEIKRAMGRT
jgi:hypothetical protein